MTVPDTIIDYMPVAAASGRQSSRLMEREAVMALLRRHFGPDAGLLHDSCGAPSVAGYDGHISISHCQGMAAIAIHPTLRIGIDLERERGQLYKIRHKYLTEQELQRATTLRRLLWAWTAKEAVYKAAGIPGLPLTSIDADESGRSATITTASGTQRYFKLYSSFNEGIMTTVAIPG